MELFQAENIIDSLKELKKEKQNNEHFLMNLRQESQQLQAKVEEAAAQHSTAKKNFQMTQNQFEIVSKRVEKLEQQQQALEDGNNQQRKQIGLLNQQLGEQTKLWEFDCQKLMEELSEIAEKLRSSPNYYTEGHLEKLAYQLEEESQSLFTKVKSNEEEITKLHSECDKVTSDNDNGIDRQNENVETDTSQSIWTALSAALERDIAEISMQLYELESNVSTAQSRLRILKKEQCVEE